MVWFRVNDGLFSDQKWSKTSSKARGLWITSGTWCAFNLTDGNVPRNMLRALGGTIAAANNLVEVGLWDETETGWSFHDWADYNPSRETVLQERKATAERVAKHRQNRQKQKDHRNGVSNSTPPRAVFPTRPDPVSTSVAGDTSSSYVSERETDTTDDRPKQGWRMFATDTDVPAGVDPAAEWDRFIERNGDGTELRDPAAAFRGWLRKATPGARQSAAYVPSRPECPEHPGQPTGSVQCPMCAREHTQPPRSLRALRDEAS